MDIIWANGAAPCTDETPRWANVIDKVQALGGVELTKPSVRGVLAFPSEEARNTFAGWYATVAPLGLQVRTAVATDIESTPVPATVPIPVPPKGIRTLKELRMWHWRQVVSNRAEQDKFEMLAQSMRRHPVKYKTFTDIAANARMQANLHLSAVQVLNDSLPGTAEHDCAVEDAKQ